MKLMRFFLGLIFSFSLMFIVLITSIEIAAYSDFSFYEKEYNKYAVTTFVGISMPELVDITKDMMSYLKGRRENISDIRANINGVENVPFFNEKEIAHMEDVKELFTAAAYIRHLLVAVSIICLILSKIFNGRILDFLSNTLIFGTLFTLCISGILVFIISENFEKYFILFHHMLFENDFWILNPANDNLINMVPQGFFVDITKRILIVFSAFIIFMIGSGMALRKSYK